MVDRWGKGVVSFCVSFCVWNKAKERFVGFVSVVDGIGLYFVFY